MERMMELTDELASVFRRAITSARDGRHDMFTTEHLLLAMLEDKDCTAHRIISSYFNVDIGEMERRVFDFFQTFMPSNLPPDGYPVEAVDVPEVIMGAARAASNYPGKKINSGHLLSSMTHLNGDSFTGSWLSEFGITSEAMSDAAIRGEFLQSVEDERKYDSTMDGGLSDSPPPAAMKPSVKKYCVNLNELAKKGLIDPLIGRDEEISRCVEILCRRKKNNPVLIGESGVGKTAIVEGLAAKIVSGETSPLIKDITIYSLNINSLVSGTRYRGDFESRMESLVEAFEDDFNAVLFIDEIHNLSGAGGGMSSGGAGDIMKPALASGRLKVIGATTISEYRQSIGKDKALARRFHQVKVSPPSKEDAVEIIDGLLSKFAEYHRVVYSPEVVREAVHLASRYITGRHLPDSAIDVIDESGAIASLERRGAGQAKVGVESIRRTVEKIAGIPLKKVVGSELGKLKNLESSIKKKVFGQDAAVSYIVNCVHLAKAELSGRDRPLGSYLFTGPTGVGKTEIARVLSNELQMPLLRFDMSEFQEKVSISSFLGAEPGYVGYDQGGQLTERVNSSPHSIILLDEIEKAHQDIHNTLLQIMDSGQVTDRQGRVVDFRNSIIIMTSNSGAREMQGSSIGFVSGDQAQVMKSEKAISVAFSPEFRNRLDAIVSFSALDKAALLKVVDKFLSQLSEDLKRKGVSLKSSPCAKRYLAKNGYNSKMGARPLERLIRDKVSAPVSKEILFGELKSGGSVSVNCRKGELVLSYQKIS